MMAQAQADGYKGSGAAQTPPVLGEELRRLLRNNTSLLMALRDKLQGDIAYNDRLADALLDVQGRLRADLARSQPRERGLKLRAALVNVTRRRLRAIEAAGVARAMAKGLPLAPNEEGAGDDTAEAATGEAGGEGEDPGAVPEPGVPPANPV